MLGLEFEVWSYWRKLSPYGISHPNCNGVASCQFLYVVIAHDHDFSKTIYDVFTLNPKDEDLFFC